MKLESHSEFNQQKSSLKLQWSKPHVLPGSSQRVHAKHNWKFSMLMQAYDNILSAPEPELPSHEKAQVTIAIKIFCGSWELMVRPLISVHGFSILCTQLNTKL